MKKLLFVLALLLAYQLSFAQIAQGTKWLSGSVSFSSGNTGGSSAQQIYYNDSKSKNNSFSLSPKFGYFFKENQLIGIGALFSGNNSHSERNSGNLRQISEGESKLYGGQMIYRKYFPLSSKFYITTEGNLNFQTGKTTETRQDFQNDVLSVETLVDSDVTKAGLGVNAVVVYFISQKFSAELNLGSLGVDYFKQKGTYQYNAPINQYESSNETNNNSINFSSSFFFNNISLGFQFYF